MVIQMGKKRRIYRVSSEAPQLRKTPLESYRKETEELLTRFDTEEKCQDHLFKWKWPEKYRCLYRDPQTQRQCGHTEFYFHKKRHLYECRECGHQASVTAGTIFEKTRTSLCEWFKMIILIVRTYRPLSTLKMKNKLCIKSYDRALRMRKKIESVLLGDTAYQQFVGICDPSVLRIKQFLMKYFQKIQEIKDKEARDKVVDCIIRDFKQAGEMETHGKKKKRRR